MQVRTLRALALATSFGSLASLASAHAQQVRSTPAGARRPWPQPAPQCPGPRLPFQALATGTQPTEVAVGDMDGDGDLDLVCAVFGNDRIELYRNQGNGEFDTAQFHPAGDGPRAISLADVDRDGDLDVLVLARNTADVLVIRNGGGGTFASTQVYDIVFVNANDLAVGDVDNDGDEDIVAAIGSDRLRVFTNDGSGSFPTTSDIFATGPVDSLLLTDLDGDGDLDVVTNRGGASASVGVHANFGGGVFGPVTATQTISTTGRMEAVDLDSDGDKDIVCGSAAPAPTPGVVVVLLNAGGLSFASVITYPAGVTPYHLAAGDVDQDGDVDIVTGDLGAGTISVLRNQGLGVLQSPEPYATGGAPWDVDLADFDGDGLLDGASVDGTGKVLTVLRQRNGGRFHWPEPVPTVSGTGATLVADLTGDGRVDLVRTRSASIPTIAFQLGLPVGQFAPAVEFASSFTGSPSLTAQDFDGDGDLDVGVLVSGFLHLHDNLGGGNFGPPTLIATGGVSNTVVAADLDADGDRDIACTHAAPDFGWGAVVHVVERTPSGHALPVAHSIPGFPDALAVADHDGDGRPDLIVSMWASPAGVLTLRNLGGLAFDPPVYIFSLPFNTSPRTTIVDLDGDGDLDYAMGRAGVVLTLGPNWVSAPSPFPIQTIGETPAAADVDADGDLDLVYRDGIAMTTIARHRVHRNDGGVFTPTESFSSITATGTFADVDGDGDADLVHGDAASVTIFRNRCH